MSGTELTQDEINDLVAEQFDSWFEDNTPMSAWVAEKCQEAFHSGWHFGREAGRQERTP
jgi:hypothetical protein